VSRVDYSLIALGAVIALGLASAAIWHLILKSYGWAVLGSSLTTGLVTYWSYPLYRGVVPSVLIITNAVVLGAVTALGVGIPFKRRRIGKTKVSDDA
jgi:hypothetical protein